MDPAQIQFKISDILEILSGANPPCSLHTENGIILQTVDKLKELLVHPYF